MPELLTFSSHNGSSVPAGPAPNPTLADTWPRESTLRVASVQRAPFPLRTKLKMRLWRAIQATFFRWSPDVLRGFRRWLLTLFGAKLARPISVHRTARIDCPWNLEMGAFASLGEESWVYSLAPIVIGEYACVGQRALLLTGTHDFCDPTFPLVTKPVVVGYGSWIAAGVIVLPGVKIGALTVVGAGSVVTRSLPEQMIGA